MQHHSIDAVAAGYVLASRVRHEVASVEAPPQLSATLDLLLEIEPRRTQPKFAELTINDDLVFARAEKRCDFEYFIGHRTVLASKLRDLAEFLELGPAERTFLLERLDTIPNGS
jgi:hypothetical protein